MTRIRSDLPTYAEALRAWISEGSANTGSIRVSEAGVSWDEDAEGLPILRFLVQLSDPSDETWPLEEILEFHSRINARAEELEFDEPRYVEVANEGAEELEPF